MPPTGVQLRVLYGGTFFPPHFGHDQIVEFLLSDPLAKALHVLPTGQNPFKEALSAEDAEFRKNLILCWLSGWQQSETQQKTLSSLARALFVPETFEIEDSSPGPRYTIDSLKILKDRHPSEPWALVVGDDQIASLEKWKNFSNLCEELEELWVFRRNHVSRFSTPHWVAKLPIRWMNNPLWNISATELRSSPHINQDLSPKVRQLWNSRYRIEK
jgi:nicotinate-nucleotide adenylyltransferase